MVVNLCVDEAQYYQCGLFVDIAVQNICFLQVILVIICGYCCSRYLFSPCIVSHVLWNI